MLICKKWPPTGETARLKKRSLSPLTASPAIWDHKTRTAFLRSCDSIVVRQETTAAIISMMDGDRKENPMVACYLTEIDGKEKKTSSFL